MSRTTILLILLLGPLLGASFPSTVLAQGEYYGNLRLRFDQVDGFPDGRDISRLRLHGIAGWSSAGDRLEWGIAARFATGSDSNDDNVPNLDNEESSTFDLGELWLRMPVGANGLIEAGQAPLPLWLTPLVWDHDFRPAGLSYQAELPVRDLDTLTLIGGYYAPHHIDEYDSRLTALQAAWRIQEGAPHSGVVALSYLEFDELEGLVEDGRTRTNRVENGRLVSDFELLDLQIQYRFPFWSSSALVSLDLVKNLGADEEDEGVRFAFIAGNGWNHGEWEVGYAYHRIQRDAVMAAFNDDDWWFPSWMRGWSPWVAYGIRDDLRLRVAAFIERRDGAEDNLDRLLVDLAWHF